MYWNTVSPLLRNVLEATMKSPVFEPFRVVGGTALSLQLGHRMSVDIDLFTDAPYNSIEFNPIRTFFKENYAYVDTNDGLPIALGTSYYVGSDSGNAIKVDIYYTDAFIRPVQQNGFVRLAHQEDIIAMKLEIIGRSGRKKDFWDIHALHSKYDLSTMIEIYRERYPYNHSESDIRKGFSDFSLADEDFDPICLKGNHWELIKLDIVNWASNSK